MSNSALRYSCIQLNAESLLLLLVWYLSSEEFRALPFAPHACASQQAEEFFRSLRAMFHDPNFTVEGALWRTSYALVDSMIQRRRANEFVFPRHHKHAHMDRVRHPAIALKPIRESDISRALIQARDDARRVLLALGVTLPAEEPTGVSPPADDPNDDLLDDVEEADLVPADGVSANASDHSNEEIDWEPAVASNISPISPLSSAVLLDPRFSQCFAQRPTQIVPIPGSSKTVLDAQLLPVDKRRACAVVSMHPSISADRVKRVQKMKQNALTIPQ
jgi:hypothetical protein